MGVESDDAAFDDGMRTLVTDLFVDKHSPLIDEIAAGMSLSSRREAACSMRSLLQWDRDARLRSVPVRVDVLASAGMLSPGAADRLAALAHVHSVDLGGHFFLREQPRATAEALAALLAKPDHE